VQVECGAKVCYKKKQFVPFQIVLMAAVYELNPNEVGPITGACNREDYPELVRILKRGQFDPGESDNIAFRFASEKGYLNIVISLLADARVDPTANFSEALTLSSKFGHVDVLERILEDGRCDPEANGNEALFWAIQNGLMEVFDLLLLDGRATPNEDTFLQSVEKGNVEMVARLLSDGRADPVGSWNESVLLVFKNRRESDEKIFRMLLEDPRVLATSGDTPLLLEALSDRKRPLFVKWLFSHHSSRDHVLRELSSHPYHVANIHFMDAGLEDARLAIQERANRREDAGAAVGAVYRALSSKDIAEGFGLFRLGLSNESFVKAQLHAMFVESAGPLWRERMFGSK
jgi:ankyrin repeat protein